MKLNPILSLILIIFFTIVSSCDLQPDLEERTMSSPLISNARSWYANQNEEILTDSASRIKYSEQRRIAEPEWAKANEMQLRLGMNIVYVPAIKKIQSQNENKGIIQFFIFQSKSGEVNRGRIIEIIGDRTYIEKNKDYLVENYLEESINGFTGSIITYDLSYRFLRGRDFVDGKKMARLPTVQPGNNINSSRFANTLARTSEETCTNWYWVTYYSDGSTTWEYLYTTCTGGGTGGGGGSGGGPGIQEIEDFTESGFPPNPYDGQSHIIVYSNGDSMEFTYSNEFASWFLPEITILDEGSNYIIESFTMTPPSFPTAEIVSLGGIAGVEPTPIGEILLGGYTIVVGTIFVYELTDHLLNEAQDREHCIKLYEACVTNKPNLPCSTCLSYCGTQGYWDFNNCPNVMVP